MQPIATTTKTTPTTALTDRTAAPSTSNKMMRYVVVTIVATPANFVLFAVGLLVLGIPAVLSNVLAATLVSIPTYVASRNWVWQLDRSATGSSEAVQYWTSTMLSLVVASAALLVLERSGAGPTVLVLTPFSVYAVLWVARYFFLDKYLFRRAQVVNDHGAAANSASSVPLAMSSNSA